MTQDPRPHGFRAEQAVPLKVVRLRPDLAGLPAYATPGAAGLDLTAALEEPLVLAPGRRQAVPTGIAIGLPPGTEAQVRPRSGLAFHHGVTLLNSPGTIDEDYRGEIKVLLINLGQDRHTVMPGDRIAQLVVARVTRLAVQEVPRTTDLGETGRGVQGFGSTGR